MIKKENLELFKAYFPYVALLAISWSLKAKESQLAQINKEWREDKDTTIKTILEIQRDQHKQYEQLLIVTNEFLKLTENEKKTDNVDNDSDSTSRNSISAK